MELGIRDKVAVVAAGSRGSGFAIARELLNEGAQVLLTGRNADIVGSAVDELAQVGTVAGKVADMSTAEGVDAIVEECRSRFGPPEILVVNPRRVSHARSLDDLSDEALRDAFETWVMSLAWFGRLVLPDMVKRDWGRIVVLGSVSMKAPHLHDPMYAQNLRSSAASFVKTLAHEYGRSGITANCIALGPIRTAAQSSYMEGAGAYTESSLLDSTALKRWGTPEEVAALTAFLCSDRAGYITGETIRIDGNYSHNLF
ncbi:SDR family oxidoreductase [Sphingobium sp. V4]|uniref:SDR family oxidoreductase n=1 Tax=Sphingobium sp. V4 TaxID=3038927 RepID=UPI0025581B9D|nr:SDR family oxidoreductase [Sphingobium sp. V4]WIW89416.1 SDR family oxidoreductase [Sphingobium sp. V4]